MNGYELSRKWFDFCFENPEKIKPNHTALFFFAIEHCNRLGWKEKFGLPSSMSMEAIGIKSYNTYINTFKDLVEWSFFTLIEKSKNQYSSNIIALSKNNKALDKALDKALIKHATKQSESTQQSTVQSIDSINKQYNKEQLNNKPINNKHRGKPQSVNFNKKDFRKILSDLGADKIHIDDWFKAREKRKAVFSETALRNFLGECEKNNYPVSEAVKICAENSWSGFKYEWIQKKGNEKGKSNNDVSKSKYQVSDNLKRKIAERLQSE